MPTDPCSAAVCSAGPTKIGEEGALPCLSPDGPPPQPWSEPPQPLSESPQPWSPPPPHAWPLSPVHLDTHMQLLTMTSPAGHAHADADHDKALMRHGQIKEELPHHNHKLPHLAAAGAPVKAHLLLLRSRRTCLNMHVTYVCTGPAKDRRRLKRTCSGSTATGRHRRRPCGPTWTCPSPGSSGRRPASRRPVH